MNKRRCIYNVQTKSCRSQPFQCVFAAMTRGTEAESDPANLMSPGVCVPYGTGPDVGRTNRPLEFCTLSFRKIDT